MQSTSRWSGHEAPRSSPPATFVVFEGIDGSGKTTVSNLVAEALRARGLRVVHVRSSGHLASQVAENIRQLARDQRNLALSPFVEFLLYVARETQQLEECILPALDDADVVIADRFLATAAVLAENGRGLPAERTAPVLRAAAGRLTPDLSILIDVDPQVARARRRADKVARPTVRTSSRKGLSGAGLMQRLRDGYLRTAEQAPDRWVVVDNTTADLRALVADLSDLIEGVRRGEPLPPRAAATAAGRQVGASSPEEAREVFLGWVDVETAREPEVAAHMLGGLFGDGVDDRRRRLAQVAPAVIAAGLRGLADPTSRTLRERLRRSHPALVARSLRGLPEDDGSAWALREELQETEPAAVAGSLDGYRGARAWSMRHQLWPEAPADVVESLAGDDGVEAWAMREQWLRTVGAPAAMERLDVARALSHSLRGVASEESWALRERAWAGSPVGVLLSLVGLDDERAWRWREQYVDCAPVPVLRSIAGLDHARAWALRERMAATCKEVLDSIVGSDGERAWQLRGRLAERWPSTVVKSLGPLGHGVRGRALIADLLAQSPGNLSLLKHAASLAHDAPRVQAAAV